jgi:hypothetical protein
MLEQLGGQIIHNPEFSTVAPALRDFDQMPELMAWWKGADANGQRTALLDISKTLRVDPKELLKQVSTPQGRELTLRMMEKYAPGKYQPETLASIDKIFNGESKAPWNVGAWKGMVANSITDHFSKWATNKLGLKPDNAVFRLAHALKAGQSLLLLGFNPAYAINNVVNDVVTRASTGIYGFSRDKKWVGDFGVAPRRVREGVGMMGDEFINDGPEKHITDAIRAHIWKS